MENQLVVRVPIHTTLYLKDPRGTALGQRIVAQGTLMIDEVGIEEFTFRKLGKRIGSPEASIYRYFSSKHQLLVYLLNYFWEWMSVRIDLNTLNVRDARERLHIALRVLVDVSHRNAALDLLDEDALHRIVLTEGPKGYHSKTVDAENDQGFFHAYKRLCEKLADLLTGVDPNFPYPRTVATMLLETANNALYFTDHLPRLSDIPTDDPDPVEATQRMLVELTERLLGNAAG